MKLLNVKLFLLVVCLGLMLPTVASAATAVDPNNQPSTISPLYMIVSSIIYTNVNGVYVPGYHVFFTKDSRVALIPGGVGLVVVDKGIPLPKGSVYLN